MFMTRDLSNPIDWRETVDIRFFYGVYIYIFLLNFKFNHNQNAN